MAAVSVRVTSTSTNVSPDSDDNLCQTRWSGLPRHSLTSVKQPNEAATVAVPVLQMRPVRPRIKLSKLSKVTQPGEGAQSWIGRKASQTLESGLCVSPLVPSPLGVWVELSKTEHWMHEPIRVKGTSSPGKTLHLTPH